MHTDFPTQGQSWYLSVYSVLSCGGGAAVSPPPPPPGHWYCVQAPLHSFGRPQYKCAVHKGGGGLLHKHEVETTVNLSKKPAETSPGYPQRESPIPEAQTPRQPSTAESVYNQSTQVLPNPHIMKLAGHNAPLYLKSPSVPIKIGARVNLT